MAGALGLQRILNPDRLAAPAAAPPAGRSTLYLVLAFSRHAVTPFITGKSLTVYVDAVLPDFTAATSVW